MGSLRSHLGGPAPGWLRLLLGAAVVVALVTALHLVSPRLPGPAGEVYLQNRELDLEATALVYSESGDIRDYLDSEHGRYRTR